METIDYTSIYALQDKVLYTIFEKGNLDWETVITESGKICILDPEVLEYRLSASPQDLLDLLSVVDAETLNKIKEGYLPMVDHILKSIP